MKNILKLYREKLKNSLRKFRYFWICIATIVLAELFVAPVNVAHAFFGTEIPILISILSQAITQVRNLQMIIGTSRDTVALLQEMNRGVKEVLRLAETAHVPLPRQVYDMANTVDRAVREAETAYGRMPPSAPAHTRNNYQTGAEGLFLSKDAFEYSTRLDSTGNQIKSSAIVANQASATRLTAESMGVLIHAVSHNNRLSAKTLEITSTNRIEQAAKDNARFENFLSSQSQLEQNFRATSLSGINSFFSEMPMQQSSGGQLP